MFTTTGRNDEHSATGLSGWRLKAGALVVGAVVEVVKLTVEPHHEGYVLPSPGEMGATLITRNATGNF